jgi:uncharacterized membrane protein YjjP (DUF1212 family)
MPDASPRASEELEPDSGRAEAITRFVLRLGRALHRYGYAAHALEDALRQVSRRLGLQAQFFTTPTSIFAAFGAIEQQRTHLLRVEPGEVDLGKLAALDDVIRGVLAGRVTPLEGVDRIDRIVTAPMRYGRALRTVAYAVSSAAACRILGGGLASVAVAAVVGFTIGLLALLVKLAPGAQRIFELGAAFTASSLVTFVGATGLSFSAPTATLAGLIVLLPGLTLTIAMTELASRHLASGTARLSAAFIVLVSLAFGVAMGSQVSGAVLGALPRATGLAVAPLGARDIPLPPWTLWVAVAVILPAFTVLLRARPKDLGWVFIVSLAAFAVTRWAAPVFDAPLAACLGALTVGVASNLYEWMERGPASVPLVHGVLLLVPGSIGYRSLTSLLDQDITVGLEAAVTMVLTAGGLAAGLLVANVLVLPRRRKTQRQETSDQ